jgi:hypothetical protein
MSGLNLSRGDAPAEVQGVDDADIERKIKDWVKGWPKVETAFANLKKDAPAFIELNRALNNAVGQKLRDKNLSREAKKALDDVLSRTVKTHQAISRVI